MARHSLMRAAIIEQFGTPDVLKIAHVRIPKVMKGGTLIRVKAASINPIDCKIRRNGFQEGYEATFPLILGLDVAGELVEMDEGLSGFELGDRVYGYVDLSRMGAHAEYVAALPSEIASIPTSMSFSEAASLPVVGITAMAGLFNLADIKPTWTVLVHGAAGGVGSIAVQLVKAKKARVIGTASTYNHEFLRSLGADEVIDYHDTKIEDMARNVDLIFDTVGGDVQERSFTLLKEGGTLISITSPPSRLLAEKYSVNTGFVWALPSKACLLALNDLYTNGLLRPVVSATFPLHRIKEAHALSETGHVRGKIVLDLKDSA